MAIGDFVGKFGSSGTGDGQFGANSPFALTTDSNYVYVSDNGNNRVQIFNKNSPYNFVAKFGSAGSGDGKFNSPRGIKLDANYIYVFDVGNDRVQIFDLNPPYVFLNKITGIGSDAEAFGIDIDTNFIYVCLGNTTPRVKIYNKISPFSLVATVGATGSGDGQFIYTRWVRVDDNYMYISDSGVLANRRIQILSKNSPYSFVGKFGSSGTGDGQFILTEGIELDSRYIYVSDGAGARRVQYFNIISPYSFIGKFGSAGTGDGQFGINSPIGLSFDGNYLYVADDGANNRVQIFQGTPSYIPGAQSSGGTAGGGASGRRLKTRYAGRSLGR